MTGYTREQVQNALSGETAVFKLATTTSISVAQIPVNSKEGTNNLWSDTGDTSLTYRSQGTAYIYPNAEEASF